MTDVFTVSCEFRRPPKYGWFLHACRRNYGYTRRPLLARSLMQGGGLVPSSLRTRNHHDAIVAGARHVLVSSTVLVECVCRQGGTHSGTVPTGCGSKGVVGPKPVRHSLPNPSLLPNPSVFYCLRAFTLVLSCPSTVIAAVHDYVVLRERINPLLVSTAPPAGRGTAGRICVAACLWVVHSEVSRHWVRAPMYSGTGFEAAAWYYPHGAHWRALDLWLRQHNQRAESPGHSARCGRLGSGGSGAVLGRCGRNGCERRLGEGVVLSRSIRIHSRRPARG